MRWGMTLVITNHCGMTMKINNKRILIQFGRLNEKTDGHKECYDLNLICSDNCQVVKDELDRKYSDANRTK